MMASASFGAAEPSGIKRVLVLHHYGLEIPFRAAFDAAIHEALRSRSAAPLEIYFEATESYRFPDAARSGVVSDYLKAKYAGRKPDVIIAVLDTALAFLRQNPDVFPDVPIVALVTRESLEGDASDVTGLQQQLAIRDTLAFALNLEPATERVFVVDGALYNTGDIEAEVTRQVEALDQRLDLVYLRDLPMMDLIARIEAIPERSILLFVRQVMWDRVTPLDLREGIRRVNQASPVPMFALSSEQIGMGPVGGHVVHYGPDAARLAEMAIRILNGESPRDIPPGRATIAATVDWRQLRRWQIPEARLPAGTIVLFREISTWERHRVAILFTSGVLVLQSLLIAGLVFERRRRRRAEIDARRHLAAMAHLDRRAAMGELATSLAHELSQPLNAILQNAGVARMLLKGNTVPPALDEMEDIIDDIRKDDLRATEMIRRMRGLLQKHELEAQLVDLNDVAEDTVAIVRPEARARAIHLELELADGMGPLLGDRVHLQQVLLNLLMNAIDAVATVPPERRRVRVCTTRSDGHVRLAVADTGAGIRAARIAEIFEPFYTTKGEGRGMGMGLAIARSIVEAHAGGMGAENQTGGGATVWFSLPVPPGPRS
jgi:signal transduction histidine kinase